MACHERVIGRSGDVAEASAGLRFPLDAGANGFVIRFRGKVSAFVNRCPHAGTELDWQPGEFFGGVPPTGSASETGGLYLVCSTHGALFEPGTGYCVAGPCRGASLERLQVRERDGRLFLEEEAAPSNDKETNPR
jgi:nitrite reductase/ring-hydroxylating ferredoxin subunit